MILSDPFGPSARPLAAANVPWPDVPYGEINLLPMPG